jgi:hypothetical protein
MLEQMRPDPDFSEKPDPEYLVLDLHGRFFKTKQPEDLYYFCSLVSLQPENGRK